MTGGKSKQSAGEVDLLVGQRIRSTRENLGMSMESLAQHIGVSWQQVQKYEQGRNRVASARLLGIAEFLGVGVGDLLGQEGSLGSAEMSRLLSIPGATSLLRDYGRITEPGHQQALLATAQSLAASSRRGS